MDPIFRIRSHIYTNFIVNYDIYVFLLEDRELEIGS